MYNVLVILSQRPLITEHHGNPSGSGAAHEAITACTAAAGQIVQILRDYSQRFSIASAPYILSYATYISATIHARIVAQKGKDSDAFQSLLFCRGILKEQKRLYAAAGKARETLDKLISRCIPGDCPTIGSPEDTLLQPSVERNGAMSSTDHVDRTLELGDLSPMNWELSDLDLDAIAQGFLIDGNLHDWMHPLGA